MKNEPDYQELIDKEQIKSLMQFTRQLAIVALLIALITANFFWGSVPDHVIITWFLFMLIVAILRISVWYLYRRSLLRFKKPISWGHLSNLVMFINSIGWGYAVIIYSTQGNFESQLYMSLIITAMSVGTAVYASISYLPMIYGFLIPSYGSIIISYSLLGSSRDFTLVSLAIIFMTVLTSFCKKAHAQYTNTLILRYQLDVKKTEAERANMAKSKFLAAASHDLRQPLQAITLFSSVLEEKVSDPDIKDIVTQLQNSIVGLKDLFNVLLDISKLDAGIVTTSCSHFELQSLFNRLQTEFSAPAIEKSLDLKIIATALYANTDAILLESILRNLLSNALRYTENGSVELHCFQDNKSICIKVIDSGVGIPSESFDDIFEEFVQLDNPERDRSKGLGLGLSIVRRLSELLNYRLELTSTVNKGTEFTLWVPMGTKSLDINKNNMTADISPHSLVGLYIVIIDDEEAIREGMKKLLSSWHCQVDVFGCQQYAVDNLSQSKKLPDVIFADYRLTENQTGVQAIEAIEVLFDTSIPAVIITGDTAPDRLREAHESGYLLLHKPVQPVQLRTYLQKINREKYK